MIMQSPVGARRCCAVLVFLLLTLALLGSNRAPLANAGSYYALTRQGTTALNGLRSVDPDRGDRIVAFEWDVDGDGIYGDLIGATPILHAEQITGGGSTHTITLRTTDLHGAQSLSSAIVHLTSEAHVAIFAPFGGTRGAALELRTPAVHGPDGRYYGMTEAGGIFGYGTIYRMESDGTGFVVIHSFGGFSGDGRSPRGRLIPGSDGLLLYGVTAAGGATGDGTIFRLKLDGSSYEILRSMASPDGRGPVGLMQATDGKLWGAAGGGGPAGRGTLFRMNPDGSAFSVMQSFDTAGAGASPAAEPLQASNGRLYGTTYSGGAHAGGTIYSLGADGSAFTVLRSFQPAFSECGYPTSGLVEGGDGLLYGSTSQGNSGLWSDNGTVFRIGMDGSGFATIYRAPSTPEPGARPSTRVLLGSDGRIYCALSGLPGYATQIVSFARDGGDVREVFAFPPGSAPYIWLEQAADGDLLVAARTDSALGAGQLLTISPSTGTPQILHQFGASPDGAQPRGELTLLSDGFITGTLNEGGKHGRGMIIRFNDAGTQFSSYAMPATEGTRFTGFGRMAERPDGTLVGISAHGDSFRFDFGTGLATDLRTFAVGTEGTPPSGGLTRASNGRYYGFNSDGGAARGGTLFSIDADGQVTPHRAFAHPYGTQPQGRPLLGPDGWIYGVTSNGGTIFRVGLDGAAFSVLHAVASPSDGSELHGTLCLAGNGRLYGVAANGGLNSFGTIYSLRTDGTGFVVLRHLDGSSDGATPSGGLIQASDGRLYGTTSRGGVNGGGTLFSLLPDGSDFRILISFHPALHGAGSMAPVIETATGAVFGTTSSGGPHGAGAIFRYFNARPLTAVAVSTRVAAVGEEVRFDASTSSDPDGDSLTHLWTISGSEPQRGADMLAHAFTEPGLHTVTVQTRDAAGAMGEVRTVTVQVHRAALSGYLAWQREHFSPDDLLDPAVSGPEAASGPTHMPNLLCYALGTAPGDTTGWLADIGQAGDNWSYTYSRPAGRDDVEYAVEFSPDLISWNTQPVTHEKLSQSGDRELWQARVPRAANPTGFFRLRARVP